MEAYPAEYYARLYLRQPWGGKAMMAYKHVLHLIREEMTNPMRRCPNCEEPGYPTMLEWPERSQRGQTSCHGRYLLCVHCGHKTRVFQFRRKCGQRPVLVPEQEKQICRLYLDGMNSNELGRMFYCSSKTILKALEKNGVKRRPTGGSPPLRYVTHEELLLTQHMHQVQRLPLKRIAMALGVSEGTMQNRIKQMRRTGWLPEKRFEAKNEEIRKRIEAKRQAA